MLRKFVKWLGTSALIGFIVFYSINLYLWKTIDYWNVSGRHPASDATEQEVTLPNGWSASYLPYVGRWKDYFRALGVSGSSSGTSFSTPGGGTQSLIEFSRRKMTDNPCFAQLAAYFYDEIAREDLKFYAQSNFVNEPLQSRPSLRDEAGSGRYIDIKPGFLWEKALRYSQGDQLLAMELLGVCGHDDVIGPRITFPTLSSSAEQRRELYIRYYKEHYAEKFCGFDSSIVTNDKCHSVYVSFEKRSCPSGRTSLMYLPKALGSQYDMTANQKQKVADVQAPTKGAASLPGKYYHIIGAAYTSCLALRHCPDSILCPRVFRYGHGVGVDYYRASVLCQNLVGSSDDFASLINRRYPQIQKTCNGSDRRLMRNYLRAINKNDCPGEWKSSDRCNAALRKIETLILDFDWSHQQHNLGIDFSINNCPRVKSKDDHFKGACEAVQKIEQLIERSPEPPSATTAQ